MWTYQKKNKSYSVKKAWLNSKLTALLENSILADVLKKPNLSDMDTLLSLKSGTPMHIFNLDLNSTTCGILSLSHFLTLAFLQACECN